MSFDLNILDYTFALMDTKERPIEFGVIFHLKTDLPKQMLEMGANKALKLYPKVACCIKGTKFEPIEGKFEIQEFVVKTQEEKANLINELLSKKINIYSERLLRQYLIHCEGKASLLSHMHHALGDGVSIIFWLQAQLGNFVKPAEAEVEFRESAIKEKLSKYVFDGLSDEIRSQEKKAISDQRKISSFFIKPPQLDTKEFTYNDYLLAAISKGLRSWDKTLNKVSIWTPMNIRKNPFIGFGNGSGRIRIYDHSSNETSIRELAVNFRQQVKWCKENGVWVVPSRTKIVKILNFPPIRWLMKKFLTRKSLDVGTTIFSHIELFENDADYFHILENIEVFNMLHHKIPISMVAVGFGNKTNFTLTYDPALFSQNDIDDLKLTIQNHIQNN